MSRDRDIVGDVLEVLGYFNWITPLGVPLKSLVVPTAAIILNGRYGVEVDRYLRRHGVKTWGWIYVNRQTLFHVKRQQERWTRYLLHRKRYPVV